MCQRPHRFLVHLSVPSYFSLLAIPIPSRYIKHISLHYIVVFPTLFNLYPNLSHNTHHNTHHAIDLLTLHLLLLSKLCFCLNSYSHHTLPLSCRPNELPLSLYGSSAFPMSSCNQACWNSSFLTRLHLSQSPLSGQQIHFHISQLGQNDNTHAVERSYYL